MASPLKIVDLTIETPEKVENPTKKKAIKKHVKPEKRFHLDIESKNLIKKMYARRLKRKLDEKAIEDCTAMYEEAQKPKCPFKFTEKQWENEVTKVSKASNRVQICVINNPNLLKSMLNNNMTSRC